MAEFDQYGRLKNRNYRPRPLSSLSTVSSTHTARRTTTSRGPWGRFNDFISDIGEWLRENNENLANNIALGGFFLTCIGAVIGAVIVLIQDGIFSAIIYAIVAGLVLYYGGLVLTGLMMYILRVPIYILGLICHNAYTLLAAIILSVGIAVFDALDTSSSISKAQTVQTVASEPTTTKYICTASTFLNVRSEPNTSARVIGSIRSNEVVEVYNIVNGFAKVKSSSGFGYASLKYLRQLGY